MILKINDRLRNRKIKFFTDFELNLKFDSIGSAFSLSYYFDPDNPEHKEFSCIGHYHLCTLEDNDELLLTGIILSVAFNDSATDQLATVSGYTLPGVLQDCEIPLSPTYTLQSDGLSLKQIAEKFIQPFGLKMVVDSLAASAMGEVFPQTTAKETQSVKSYLSELASQKNIILTHDEQGRLVFTKATSKQKPIFSFERGMPGVSMALAFNGQGMHSKITAIKDADIEDGSNASQSPPLRNPFSPVTEVFRPHTIIQNSGNGNDTEATAANALARELKNLQLVIKLDRWTLDGKIVKPGKLVSVINQKVYLYKRDNWFIESVDFKGNAKSKEATLHCVRPEVYTGETPQYIWKGINLH